jgi:hypothetical protein
MMEITITLDKYVVIKQAFPVLYNFSNGIQVAQSDDDRRCLYRKHNVERLAAYEVQPELRAHRYHQPHTSITARRTVPLEQIMKSRRNGHDAFGMLALPPVALSKPTFLFARSTRRTTCSVKRHLS